MIQAMLFSVYGFMVGVLFTRMMLSIPPKKPDDPYDWE